MKLSTLIEAGAIQQDGTVTAKPGTSTTSTLQLGGEGNLSLGAAQAVQASPALTLPDAPSVLVTGVERIASITPKDDGTTVRLRFDSDLCAVMDSTTEANGGNLNLSLGSYISRKNCSLTLYCEGGVWYEQSRSNPTILDVWYYNRSSQVIPADDGTGSYTGANVQWTDNGYFYYPKDPIGLLCNASGNNPGTPTTDAALRLPYIGLYDITFAVTFSNPYGEYSVGYRRMSLGMFFEEGTPDGTSPDQWVAIGDGNQFNATYFRIENNGSRYGTVVYNAVPGGKNEITLVGACQVYSNGRNLVKLSCSHGQEEIDPASNPTYNVIIPKDLTISREAYETFIRISYRGH